VGVIDGRVVAVDEAFIPAYSRRDPEDTRRGYSDGEATLRRHGQRSLFGYGAIVAADARSELPWAAFTVPVRENEKRHILRVVGELPTGGPGSSLLTASSAPEGSEKPYRRGGWSRSYRILGPIGWGSGCSG
jgi:hypothetical protein